MSAFEQDGLDGHVQVVKIRSYRAEGELIGTYAFSNQRGDWVKDDTEVLKGISRVISKCHGVIYRENGLDGRG
jgi:hypothetical protein